MLRKSILSGLVGALLLLAAVSGIHLKPDPVVARVDQVNKAAGDFFDGLSFGDAPGATPLATQASGGFSHSIGYWMLAALVAIPAILVARSVRPDLRNRVLFGLTAALALMLGFVSFRHAPFLAVQVVSKYGYWQILLAAVLFAACLIRSLGAELRRIGSVWRIWLGPLAAILGAAAFLNVEEPHELKIVMDEVVLQSTSMRMHFQREASVVVRGYDMAGNFKALVGYVDKRPLFFPFLLSVVHDFTGYRVKNAYFLNGALTVAFTALLFLACRRIAGPAAGFAGLLLAVSIPLVHQNATGSGFELLNLVMILSTLWLGMRYAERPDTDRLGAFILSGILLAQTRYESALFVAPVGVAILHSWWRRRTVEFSWPVLIAPLLVVVIPLHFNVFKIATTSWQLNDIAGADEVFGPRYFYDNVGHAMNFFFSIDGSQPNSILVALLGVVGLGFFMLTLYREHRAIFRDQPANAVFGIFIIGLLAHTALMLLYFWGHFDDPVIRRLSLPCNLMFILGFIFVFTRLVSHPRRWQALMGATALFIVAVTIPATAMASYDKENFAARTNNWLAAFIDGLGDDSALAIDSGNGIEWFIRGKSSVAVDALAAAPEKFAFNFKNRTFKDFFIVQRLGHDFNTGERFPTMDDDVGQGLKLEMVDERAFSPVYYVRISRVVDVDLDKLKEWSARRLKAVQITPEIGAAIRKGDNAALDRWFKMLP